MRIVSGSARGRSLLTPPAGDRTIRPTSDRTREALFSILGKTVVRARVLDLFAGTGALGLEAYSRGAALVVFIDSESMALDLIRRNIARLFAEGQKAGLLQIVRHDLATRQWQQTVQRLVPGGFDLIFADPPYGKGLSEMVIDHLGDSPLLAEGGLLVVEERSTIALPMKTACLCQIDRRRYGEAGLWFYQHHRDQAVAESDHPPHTPFTSPPS